MEAVLIGVPRHDRQAQYRRQCEENDVRPVLRRLGSRCVVASHSILSGLRRSGGNGGVAAQIKLMTSGLLTVLIIIGWELERNDGLCLCHGPFIFIELNLFEIVPYK